MLIFLAGLFNKCFVVPEKFRVEAEPADALLIPIEFRNFCRFMRRSGKIANRSKLSLIGANGTVRHFKGAA